MPKRDFLDELIKEGTTKDARFPAWVEAAYRRRVLLRTLAARRQRAGVTQKEVADAMKTSQSAVARMERGEIDPKLSTIERYADAIGHRLEWRVTKART